MTIDGSINVGNLIASVGLVASAVFVAFQIKAKRADEQWARQLARIDRQLSDLYGPLYALYESGDKEWRAFRREYSNQKDPEFLGFFPDQKSPDFAPPNQEQLAVFRLWTEAVFLSTNTRMADTMIDHAELLIGKTMPHAFLDFCVHVTSLRATAQRWNKPSFDPADWKQHVAIFPHPAAALHNYIRASFTVLKDAQSQLLSRARIRVTEGDLEHKIRDYIGKLEEEERDRMKKSKTAEISKSPPLRQC